MKTYLIYNVFTYNDVCILNVYVIYIYFLFLG